MVNKKMSKEEQRYKNAIDFIHKLSINEFDVDYKLKLESIGLYIQYVLRKR